tara:strand:+ start:306 stop:962 length:657 start_codon:yes stop_codon:yes gene_type:complete
MRIDRAGIPFVFTALISAFLFSFLNFAILGVGCCFVAGFFLFFFRDPERKISDLNNAVLSPADGKVIFAGPAENTNNLQGEWFQISIFLSPLDVHVNRVPIAGTVSRIKYYPGKFLPAYKKESGVLNERCEIWLNTGDRKICFRQVVGVLARRIVCRLKKGERVQAGQRFGVMKFGSRMDVFIEGKVKNLVAVDDIVKGGQSVLAMLLPKGNSLGDKV